MKVMILSVSEQVLALPPTPSPGEGGRKRPLAGKLVRYPPGPLSGKGADCMESAPSAD